MRSGECWQGKRWKIDGELGCRWGDVPREDGSDGMSEWCNGGIAGDQMIGAGIGFLPCLEVPDPRRPPVICVRCEV